MLALGAGALMGLAPEPIGWWPLAWVAIVPLWWLAVDRSARHRDRWLWGWLWGLGYNLLTVFWLTGMHPMTWLGVSWTASLTITLTCWLVAAGWAGAQAAVWAGVFGAIGRWPVVRSRPILRLLIGLALWLMTEALWNQSPLAWTGLGLTQAPHNLGILHLGQLAGPAAVTGSIVLVNGLGAEGWLTQDRRWWIGAIAALILLQSGGAMLAAQPLADRPSASLTIGVIQGNIPNELKFGSDGWRLALTGYRRGYETLAAAGVDGVLIPETALPIVWTDEAAARNRSDFVAAVVERGVPAWIGGFAPDRQRPDRITNSLLALDRTGQAVGRYDKVRLVPLGEYIPFENWIGGLIDRLSPLEAKLALGRWDQQLTTPFGPAIALICYDSANAELARSQAATGGQFILSAANNAHYRPTMFAQHHAQDVMRAIETDRWVARAANTGYSAFIDPHGRTLWRSRPNTYAIHATEIYRRQTQTLYVRWGDWLTPWATALAVGGAIVAWRMSPTPDRNRI
ncbi:MAG: apolipoprotein N-acyltransferase [Oscillatoriales cyanobacterium]|nr:MAG: apolipoprotein N-acyltransferase [Oscillatoriales cyanobacterium]